jgi:hypothetical protein
VPKLIRIAFMGLLFLIAGCSTLNVRTDYELDYDFTSLKTYAWLQGKAPSTDIRINNSLIINRVIKAINHELQAKGYRLVEKDKADFYVNWFGGIEEKMRQETINTYYGGIGYGYGPWTYGGFWPAYSQTYDVEYQEGTLIIDIADSKSKKLVWRGTGQDYVENQNTPEKITEGINTTVASILSKFPPDKKAAEK